MKSCFRAFLVTTAVYVALPLAGTASAAPVWPYNDAYDDWANYLPVDVGSPQAGEIPTAVEQHYWQSRGDIYSTNCMPGESEKPCDAHVLAVNFATRWARDMQPGCTKMPKAIRKSRPKRKSQAVMLQMYIALSKSAWVHQDQSAAKVWRNSAVLNRWCPGLRDKASDDLTY